MLDDDRVQAVNFGKALHQVHFATRGDFRAFFVPGASMAVGLFVGGRAGRAAHLDVRCCIFIYCCLLYVHARRPRTHAVHTVLHGVALGRLCRRPSSHLHDEGGRAPARSRYMISPRLNMVLPPVRRRSLPPVHHRRFCSAPAALPLLLPGGLSS